MIIDDAWAEHELEKQLRSLTPIECLEEAEHKLKLSYNDDDNSTAENFSSFPPEDECLPDSAEVFLSLIQHASNVVEQELAECKTLIEKQIELSSNTESEEEEEEEEEEETVILTNSVQDEYDSSPDQKEGTLTFTQNYQLKVQSDLPIYQVPDAKVPAISQPEARRQVEVEEKERIERETVRKVRLEDEKRRLEKLQQEELKKIEEEMRLAEEALRIEVLEHEKRMKQLNEQHALEKKMYEEDMRRREEEVMIKKEQSATKIQAHFRGMRARRSHGKVLERRIKEKKRELFEEQLQYYEELICTERAAVEAELEARRQEELEKQRAEARAEEIRERHLGKDRSRKMKEERKRVEVEERERARKREEEERGAIMTSEQVLHWLKKNDSGEKSFESAPEQKDLKAVDNTSSSPKSRSPNQKKNEKLVKESASPKNADLEDNIDKMNKVVNEKHQVCNTPSDANVLDNLHSNLNVSAKQTNLNRDEHVDNYNVNQGLKVDNKVLMQLATPDNDNAKKSKSSFLGNIASRAKNIFKPFSSNELSKENQTEGMQVDNESGRSENITTETEDLVKESSANERSVKDVETVKHSQPVPQSDDLLKQSSKLVVVLPDVTRTKPSAGPSPSPETAIKPKTPPLIACPKAPPVSSQEEPITSPRSRSTMSPHHKTLSPDKPSKQTLLHKTNPLTLSIDTSLTPRPPQRKHTASLDLSKPSSQAAKAEYRRKRKLRNDLSLARELSDITMATPPSGCITPVDISWDEFVSQFEESYIRWRDLNLSWNEFPRPPSTAGPACVLPNNYSQIEPRVLNGITLIEHYESAAVTNPHSTEVYVKNCDNLEIAIDQSCDKVRLLSLEHCTNCTLHVANSYIRCMHQNSCELTKIGKVPGSLVLLDNDRNNITRLSPLSCSNLVVLTVSHNSLVSTRGLQHLPNLVTLDLSYNNLSHVLNLHHCGVLQHLNISHNQLVSVPNLQNNILLATLDLSANGLTDLTDLATSWLPCLMKLKLVANGLDSIPLLYKICPLLRSLDVSNNMLSHTQEFTTSLQYCKLDDILFEGTQLASHTIYSYVNSMRSVPGPFSKLINFFLEVQNKLRQEMDLSLIVVTEKVESLRNQQQTAKQIRSDIVNILNLQQSVLKDTVTHSAVTKCQTLDDGKEEDRADVPGSNNRRQTLKRQPGDYVMRTNSKDFDDLIKDQDLLENLMISHDAVLSRGDAMTSRGDVMTSRGAVMMSRDDVMTSRGDVMTSRVDVMTSRGDVMTSRGDVMTSRDSAILILQSLIRGFKSRLRSKNLCDQRREAMCKVYYEMCGAAEHIQRIWRGFVVRKLLWEWLPWLHRRREHVTIRDRAAVKIQSVFRGYMLRRRLSEVFEEAVYDISDIADCDNLQQIGSLDFDELDCERGWGLPPTPSLQHHTPLPSPSLQHHVPLPSQSFSSRQSISDMTEGPVPLLPISKLRSSDTSRAPSLRSEISVLSLPPSRRVTPSKRQAAIATEWGIKNQDTLMRLVQRSKKFGKQISQKTKRDLVRQKILEGSRRMSLVESPPPPSADSTMEWSDSVEYQWDVPSLRHQTTSLQEKGKCCRTALHTQIYRNPKFNKPSNTSLPPLIKKPDRPKYNAFR